MGPGGGAEEGRLPAASRPRRPRPGSSPAPPPRPARPGGPGGRNEPLPPPALPPALPPAWTPRGRDVGIHKAAPRGGLMTGPTLLSHCPHPPPPDRTTALCAAPTPQSHRVPLHSGPSLPFPAVNSVSRPPPPRGNLFPVLKLLPLFQFNTRFYFPLAPKMLHGFCHSLVNS